MSLEVVLRLIGGVLLVAANAFFVAVEFALTRLRGLDLSEEEIDEQGLRTAWDLTDRLEIHLTSCQLGISSTSVLLGVVAEPAVTEVIEPVVGLVGVEGTSVRAVSIVVGLVILNLIHKIWGEQAPTYLGVERPREVARALAPALAVWSTVMKPIVALGDDLAKGTLGLFGVTITRSWTQAGGSGSATSPPQGERGTLVERIAEVIRTEDLPEDRREEILQAVRIDDIECADVMIPVDDIVFLHLDDAPRDLFRRIASEGYTRYPVTASADTDPSSRRNIEGVCYTPSLFGLDDWPTTGEIDLEPLLSPPCFIPADTSIADTVDRLQSVEQEVALLTDPDASDRVVGMITVSDAFEVIAGELRDPLDAPL
ncbi:MAG TPA: CNNM domain-containing protein [Longimicrobiales bacterium]|nr:CNNM domain-containing protein [Longimicrobiales bacterium]